MNLREIHEIIQQISETLECPRCNARIAQQFIHIAEIKPDGDYLFDVECPSCDAEMSLSAHVEKVGPAKPKPLHEDTDLLARHALNKKHEPPITAQEVSAIKQALSKFCGSFIETFG